MSKWYPSKIKIELIEREPIAILNVEPLILLYKNIFVLPKKIIKSDINLKKLVDFHKKEKR